MMDLFLSFLASALTFLIGCLVADQVKFVIERRSFASFRWRIIWTLGLVVAVAALVPWAGWPACVAAFYILLFLISVLRGPDRSAGLPPRRFRDDVADAVDQPYPGRPRAT